MFGFGLSLSIWTTAGIVTLRAGVFALLTPVGVGFCASVKVGPEAHPVSCTIGIGSPYRRRTAGAWRWPPTPSSSTKVKERVQLHFYPSFPTPPPPNGAFMAFYRANLTCSLSATPCCEDANSSFIFIRRVIYLLTGVNDILPAFFLHSASDFYKIRFRGCARPVPLYRVTVRFVAIDAVKVMLYSGPQLSFWPCVPHLFSDLGKFGNKSWRSLFSM
jgi:hypothetical protein